MSVAAETCLNHIEILDPLTAEAKRELAADLHEHRLQPGEHLFDAGDSAGAVYFVADGELEILRPALDSSDLTRINVVREGSVIGELAVLRQEHRSASVRASVETLVYSVSAARFVQLIRTWPAVALAIARSAANHLVRVEQRTVLTKTPVWWVVSAPRLPATFTAALLDAVLKYLPPASQRRPVIVVASGEHGVAEREGVETLDVASSEQLGEALREASARAALVVVCAPASAQLASSCTAAIVLGRSELAPKLRHVHIIHTGMTDAHHVKPRRGATLDSLAPRIARLLLNRTIGLVLGGGGALGIAHLGVLAHLEAHAIPVDFVAGASMGAIVGGVYASSGYEVMEARVRAMTRPFDWLTLIDRRALATGVLSGERIRRFIDELLTVHEARELTIPYAAIAFNVADGEEVVIRDGRLSEIMYASMTIPGIMEPPIREVRPGVHRQLVDGGLIDNVPVELVRAMGADKVIGVNVMGKPEVRNSPARRLLGMQPGLSRARLLTHAQLMSIIRAGERQVFAADVAITPNTESASLFEFWKGPQLIECGRRAAEAMHEQLVALESGALR